MEQPIRIVLSVDTLNQVLGFMGELRLNHAEGTQRSVLIQKVQEEAVNNQLLFSITKKEAESGTVTE